MIIRKAQGQYSSNKRGTLRIDTDSQLNNLNLFLYYMSNTSVLDQQTSSQLILQRLRHQQI